MPTWPASLPQLPLSEGYQEQPGPNVLESHMDTGPDKRRLRYTKTNDPHQMLFELDATQFATLKAFFNTTLMKGALAFDYIHPTDGVLAYFVFKGQPVYRNVGGAIYQAQCALVRTG